MFGNIGWYGFHEQLCRMLIPFCRPYLGFRSCWVGVSSLTPALEPHRWMETKCKIFSLFITGSNKFKYKTKPNLFLFFCVVLTWLVFFWGYQLKVGNPAGGSVAHCFCPPHPSYLTVAWTLFKISISWMIGFMVSPNENRNVLSKLPVLSWQVFGKEGASTPSIGHTLFPEHVILLYEKNGKRNRCAVYPHLPFHLCLHLYEDYKDVEREIGQMFNSFHFVWWHNVLLFKKPICTFKFSYSGQAMLLCLGKKKQYIFFNLNRR